MRINIVNLSSFVTKEISESLANVGDLCDAVHLQDVKSSFFVLCNGRKVENDVKLEDGKTYHIVPKFPGGKGGFGSMLRAIGAQIEKTTSREACRDLSGRRMRDINNEKKLKEWLSKEADREHEREQRRQERLKRQLEKPQHKFDDAEYHEQRAKMQEDLQDAVTKGLKRTHKKDKHHSSDKKLRTAAGTSGASKTEWLGLDIESDTSSSSDNEAYPGDPLSNGAGSCSRSDDCQKDISDELSEITTEIQGNHLHSSQDVDDPSTQKCLSSENKVCDQEKSEKNTHNVDDMVTDIKQLQPDQCDVTEGNEYFDLDNYSSSQDLVHLGMERLKQELMNRGLKCGGTLSERADRLFSVKGLSSDQIDPSLFAKGKGKGKKSK